LRRRGRRREGIYKVESGEPFQILRPHLNKISIIVARWFKEKKIIFVVDYRKRKVG
jgi:hypothetical protein